MEIDFKMPQDPEPVKSKQTAKENDVPEREFAIKIEADESECAIETGSQGFNDEGSSSNG